MADAEVGRRVAEARAELGLTQAEVAAKLGVARSTLAEMETGERRITADELYRLAELLSRPLQYFLSPQEPASIFAFRLRSEEIGEPARRALVHLDNRLADLAALERFSGVTVRPQVQQYRINAWKSPDVAGRNAARLERARLQLGTSPAPNVREVLEQRAGLLAFGDYVPSAVFPSAYASDGKRSALLINVAHSRDRANFALAHEYAHALLVEDGVHIEVTGYANDSEERFASAFAANLLMPLEVIQEALEHAGIQPPEISADQVLFLASQFGVSFGTVLSRLAHLGMVERPRASQLRRAAKALARSHEASSRDPFSEFGALPETYRGMAFQAFHKGSISRSRLAEFLAIDPDEAYDSYVAWATSMQVASTGEGKRGATA